MDSLRFSKSLSTNKISQDPQTTSTYYYSKFDLFDDSLNFFFLKYQIFKKILRLSLGETWHTYAKETLFREVDHIKIFLPGEFVFNQALELWLELRKEISLTVAEETPPQKELQETNKNLMEKKFEDNNIYEIFEIKFAEKCNIPIFINYTCFKAVLQGFYATANKVWKDTIEEHDLNINFLKPENEINPKYFEEESNFQYLKNTLKSFTKSSSKKIIKPLLIASEKILDYFSVSKKYFKSNEEEVVDIEEEISNDAKNFSNFQSNVQQETPSELLKIKMQNLSLTDTYEERLTNLNKKRKLQEANESNSRIEIKKFTKKAEKMLNPTFVNYASDYIEKFMENSKEKWQVARGFVTNIIEVNYNLFSNLEMKLSNKAKDLKDHIKIRFLQPAQTFYHHLMKVWLIFKTNDFHYEFSFQEYLEKVKISMGSYWNERYLMPTQVFFETLINEWNQIKAESENEENLRLFIKKVRLNLLNIWEENVVKKIENINLMNPTILKNNG